MRTMMKKLLCIVISLIFTVTFLTSCGSKDATNISGERETADGTHDLTAPEVSGDDYFIKDGRSEYVLVIPSNASNELLIAVEEFNSLIAKATSLTFGFVRDNTVTYNENSKHISLGDTTLVEQAGITFDKSALSTDGCMIKTKGKTMFLLGANDGGVINAVYDFMKIYFNYEFYYRNCIEIDKNVTDVKLRNFDVVDVPDIAIRKSPHEQWSRSGNEPYLSDTYAFGDDAKVDAKNRTRRYRFNFLTDGLLMPIHSEFGAKGGYRDIHNVNYFVTDSQVKQGWRSSSGEQLCYSASSHTDHFDEDNFNALAKHCAQKIIDSMIAYPRDLYPQYVATGLTQNDAAGFCACATCEKWKAEDNGAISGGMIRLNNRIMEFVNEWMEKPENEPYRRENFKLLFFAYSLSEDAPVIYDEKAEKYVPANKDVVMSDSVGVYYAPISSFKYTRSIYDPINDKGRDILKKWDALTDDIWLWTYGHFYKSAMYFCDTFNFFDSDCFSFFANNGVSFNWTETSNTSIGGVTSFESLLAYVQSKLMWDSSLDSGELIENYMNAMYGEAADTMSQMLLDCRMHFSKLSAKEEKIGVGSIINKQEYYEPSDFERWIGYTDLANQQILKYKETNPELYYVLNDRIELEAVGPIYCYLDLYGGDRGTPPFTFDQRKTYVDRLEEVATRYPSFRHSGYTPLMEAVKNWR